MMGEPDPVTEELDPVMEELYAWRRSAFMRSVGLGASCGAALGVLLGLFLMEVASAALAVPFTAVAGAVIGAVGGLTGGTALLACGPVVRRSRAAASLVTGAGAAAIPLPVMLWIVIRHWPSGSGHLSIAAALIAFATGAAVGPLAVAGRAGWSRRRSDGPPVRPGGPA